MKPSFLIDNQISSLNKDPIIDILEEMYDSINENKKLITKEDFSWSDDIWSEYFYCQNCGNDEIQPYFNYCPMCGIKIEFDDEIKKQMKDGEPFL